MGKAALYLNIRDSLSIPGLTQKMRCNCRFLISQRMVYADSRKARMGKSALYLNIRDNLSHPGLTAEDML